jgi:hypothetical protein
MIQILKDKKLFILPVAIFLIANIFFANSASAMLPPPPPMPTPPVLTLNGSATATILINSTYTDAGATAVDSYGTDITSLITVEGLPLDTSILGTNTITYNVNDFFGIPATPVTRVVNVVPLPKPVVPTETDQCKKNGWRNFGDMFKNQGDCVSFVATNGKNQPDGPAKH